MWEKLIESLAEYGVAGIIAGILLWIFYKVLNNFMTGLKDDRDNYMKIIERQNTTQNNHIAHLDEAVKQQSTLIVQQGERFSNGIDKLCDALDGQTEVLKEHIRSSSRN